MAINAAMNLSMLDRNNGDWCAPSAYIGAICAKMADVRLESLKMGKSVGWKRVCQVNGCSSRIHGLFWKQGYCYPHEAVKRKKCIKCKLRKKELVGICAKTVTLLKMGGLLDYAGPVTVCKCT